MRIHKTSARAALFGFATLALAGTGSALAQDVSGT